jgi:hypothetical protein
VTLLAAALAALQTYLHYSERAETRRRASGSSDVARVIQEIMATGSTQRELNKRVKEVDHRLDLVGDPAPNVAPPV